MENANKADHTAVPATFATDATDDAMPFSWPLRSGEQALLMTREIPV